MKNNELKILDAYKKGKTILVRNRVKFNKNNKNIFIKHNGFNGGLYFGFVIIGDEIREFKNLTWLLSGRCIEDNSFSLCIEDN